MAVLLTLRQNQAQLKTNQDQKVRYFILGTLFPFYELVNIYINFSSFLFIVLYQIGHLEATQEADFLLGHLISYKDYFERDEGSYFLIWEMSL